MNRARRRDESFAEYREALKAEQQAIDLWMQGIPESEGMSPMQFMAWQQQEIVNLGKHINDLEHTILKVHKETTDEDMKEYIHDRHIAERD